MWDKPEAQMFKARAIKNGVEQHKIVTEEKSTNTGENISYSRKLLPNAKSIIFVQKPNTILRVKLTVPLKWPNIIFYTACPSFSFPEDISNIISIPGIIHEMV
ncbi:MAG: uncharacterized SAM-binding protein YcdF (DUF218 family), partial [Francisellaceae bacterium]